MPTFTYKTKNSSGDTVKGEREAPDKYELYKILKNEGLETSFCRRKKNGLAIYLSSLHLSIGGKVKAQDKINFARNLGSDAQGGACTVPGTFGHRPSVKE